MELNVVGHLLGEKNPMFSQPDQTLGHNDLKYLIISCFEKEDVDKFKNIIVNCNGKKPLEERMSFPVGFEKTSNGLACHVMCKLRNPQPDTLLKRIDFLASDLRAMPMKDWVGKKFIIRVKVFKYNFAERDPELIKGGSSTIHKGYTYHIKNIKLAS
jgi:hypothetical protein